MISNFWMEKLNYSNISRNMKQVLISGPTQADVADTEGDEM